MASENIYTSRQKFLQLYETLKKSIEDGQFKSDQKLPTEIELADQYNLSRPTVAKALDMLRKEGFIERTSGIGTFVRFQPKTGLNNFGLLIPGLGETEIFESICGHMSHLAQLKNFNLIWSGSMQEDASMRKKHIEQLAGRYIEQHIDGVFFTPLELTSEKDMINQNIAQLFDQAGIPVVLMDRDIVSFPLRSRYDLVGVDNFRLAFILTQHLLEQGCARVKFVARPYSAPTVQMRIFGYLQALQEANVPCYHEDIFIEDTYNKEFIEQLLRDTDNPGVLCANDTTASRLMHALTDLDYKIPEDVKVAGVDDIKYANYLRVPLTTYKQPCKDIAKTAIDMMLSRIAEPQQKARTVYLDGELVVRKSTC
jgi:DNA-binding LacI/PurR family transcriptional regulator